MTSPDTGTDTDDDTVEQQVEWHHLDPRMLALSLSVLIAPIAAFVGTAVVNGGRIPPSAFGTLYSVGGVFVIIVVLRVFRYLTTHYRITAARVELRTGLLSKRHLSIPRDRIRSVDLTANPLHRIFGLSVVKVGTGQTAGPGDSSGELSLDAVTRTRADELRRQLLDRSTTAQAPAQQASSQQAPAAVEAADDAPAEGRPIATIQWGWARYAPLTIWTLLIAVILVGGAFRVLDAVGLDPFSTGLATTIYDRLRGYSLGLIIVVGVIAVLVVGVIGATIIYIESWWAFRLSLDGGVFHVRRGLLTTRSVSIEERRLRGVEVIEPITMRWAGGAETKAVATGLVTSQKDQQKGKDALLPPAPLAVAHRVTAEVLAEDETPVAVTDLRRHPRSALRRRINRAVVPPLVFALALAVASVLIGWLPGWVAIVVLALVIVTIPLAFDAYRNLGHTLTARYLVTRYGTVFRHTVALRRSGVIGWTVSRSFFQRRVGLATVAATTGAGGGAYKIRDVSESEGLAFAEEAVPDLLTPFLER